MSSNETNSGSEADLRSRLDALERRVYFQGLGRSNHPFAWVCLTVGQVVSVLGCIGSVIYPIWHFAIGYAADGRPPGAMQAPPESPGWVVFVVILGACVGFFYSAGMFIVFCRAKRVE